MENFYYNSIKIFISSPGDVEKERKAAGSVIAAIDRSCRGTIGLRTELVRWEDLPPLTPLRSEGEIQDVILKNQVRTCNVFVLILNKRYGSVSQGSTQSNTEREVDTALEMIDEGRSITLLSYFHSIPSNPDPGEQEKKLLDLQERLRKRNLFYYTYKNVDDFKQRLTHDLYYVFMKFRLSTTKQRALRYFWSLGTTEGQTHPALAIIYPPVDRSYMPVQSPDRIWLDRLVPYIVFEDFKALHKVDKTVRLIGLNNIRTYSSASFPQDVYEKNRVWLCLPRNVPGLNQLRNYEEQAVFKLEPRNKYEDRRIFWKNQSSGNNFFSIRSPLAIYLENQRGGISGGEWTSAHGRIIAKDYAILARFPDCSGRRETIDGTLKDYFLAGIRGLGTWGAGWFIDRKYKNFLGLENRENDTLQMLLEVTYKNEFIDDVRDVSNMPKEYFEQEHDVKKIQDLIKDHQSSVT